MAGGAKRLFCFGLGYSARALGRRLRPFGWTIAGTCQTPEARAELVAAGFEVHLFDRDRPLADLTGALAGATWLLSTVPPDEHGDPVIDCHGAALAAADPFNWVGYLSTTGVYGDRGGGRVDETSALRPSTARSRRRVAAEAAWLGLERQHELPVHVFRLAGIYGPGRSQLDQVRAGTARRIVKPGQVFSRIHVDDLAAVLEASMAGPNAGAVYNVCDDMAAPPQDVVAFACQLLGVAPPPPVRLEDAELGPMARSFYAENKRVDNRRIKRELGVTLKFPSYREGLAELLRQA